MPGIKDRINKWKEERSKWQKAGDIFFWVLLIALIIPGLSGGTLAIYLGIYERLLHAIGHVFSELKRSLGFLIPLFL